MIRKSTRKGVIFGKFYPLHIGHLDFIQRMSFDVETLYVVMCTDDRRDKKLYDYSNMRFQMTEEDRINFLRNHLSAQKNIKILHLREDGINPYPNGWFDWSIRVKELFGELNENFNVVFCNEEQDVPNYFKYFSDIVDLEVITNDIQRTHFNISATKIRNAPYENWEYMPIAVKNFFRINILFLAKNSANQTLLDVVEKLSNYFSVDYFIINNKNTNIKKFISREKIAFFIMDERVESEFEFNIKVDLEKIIGKNNLDLGDFNDLVYDNIIEYIEEQLADYGIK